jgi:fermentation-respiration switch protein FrsA (DUF1100 family)
MFAAALEPKDLWLIDGAAHADLFSANPAEYRERVGGFLDHHFRIRREHASQHAAP